MYTPPLPIGAFGMGNTQQRYEKYFIYFYLIDKKKHLLLESSPNMLLSRYIIYGSFPQFRSIILCDLLLYIDVTFWYLSIDLGLFWGSWFLHRHEIPHPNPMGDMIATKKYCLFKEYFRVVCFICI